MQYPPFYTIPRRRTLNEITSFAADALTKVNSLLIVCNKKQEAEHLFRALKPHAELSCHLSAAMCTAHRRDVLEQLNAGRCNRHGECELPAPVYVVPCLDEDLKKLPEINNAKKSTDSLLDAFRRAPQQFDWDLSSEKAIQRYYQTLYRSNNPDFPIKQKGKSLFAFYSATTSTTTKPLNTRPNSA